LEKKNKYLPDILIILGMIVLVFCACQPFGRKWDEKTAEMFTGSEGVYSPDTDSYYYFRKAKEYTEGGFASIRITASRAEDSLVSFHQTEESDTMPTLLSALAAILWYMLRGLGIRVGIYAICTRLCGFLLALCVVPTYCFLVKRLSRVAAAFGALTVTLAPAAMHHAFCGFFDTDALVELCALCLVLSFYDSVLVEGRRRQAKYVVASLMGVAFLAMTWKVFHVYVAIAAGTMVTAIIISRLFLVKKERRSIDMRIPIVAIGVLSAVTLLLGFEDFLIILKGVLASTGKTDAWPPTYQNVGEMIRPGLIEATDFWELFMTTSMDYVSYVGGVFMALFLMVSVVLCIFRVIRLKKSGDGEYERTLVLYGAVFFWFLGTAVMSAVGIRFVEFLILPTALIVAFGFDIVAKELVKEKRPIVFNRILFVCCSGLIFMVLALMFPVQAVVLASVVLFGGFFVSRHECGRILVGALFAVLLIGNLTGAYLRAGMLLPIVEKPTEEALCWIRENTEGTAVIADYWSWGYIYQYYAERRPLDDGGTYSGEASYWLATMFFSEDLRLSAGIARMLQGGSIEGIDYATEVCGGEMEAAAFLKEILPKSRQEAEEYIKRKGTLSEEEQVKLLNYTHPLDCPEIYLITNYDTLRVSATMSTISRWDFLGKTPDPVATLFSQQSVPKPNEGETAICFLWKQGIGDGWNVQYTVRDGEVDAKLGSPNGEGIDFPRIIYYKDGIRVYDRIKTAPEDGLGFADRQALIILEEQGRLSSVMVDESLVNSALVRLYVLDDIKQDVFEKVYEAEIPETVSGESSKIQRKLGTKNTREYNQCGVVVWKVHFE